MRSSYAFEPTAGRWLSNMCRIGSPILPAITITLAMLGGCSGPSPGAQMALPNVIRVLPDGERCEVSSRIVACAEVPKILREELGLGRFSRVTLLALPQGGPGPDLAPMARLLRDEGFWRVGTVKVGLIQEHPRRSQPQ